MDEVRELNDFQKAFRDKEMAASAENMQQEVLEDEFENEDTQKGRYMTFGCDNDYYGIEITYVNEIVGIQPIAELPETPDFVKGLINLRGKIIPILDVRLRFGKEPLEYTDRTCVIVINVEEDTIGLIVDSIADVVSIPDEEILDPPSVGSSKPNPFVKGIGKVDGTVKLLLDPAKLIYQSGAVSSEL